MTIALFSLPQFGRLAHVYVKLMYTAGPIIMLLLLALAFNLSPRWMPWC